MDDEAVVRRSPEPLTELQTMAGSLRELPLDGIEPVLGPPRWT